MAAATAKSGRLSSESAPFNPTSPFAVPGPYSSPFSNQPRTPSNGSLSVMSGTFRSQPNSPYASSNDLGMNGNNNSSNGNDPAEANPNTNATPKYTFEHEGETLEIRNVWAENVAEEMAVIREVIEKFPYVAMDTEFPGVVAKPVTEAYTSDYHYRSLKVNVDLLKIIQLGLSFATKKGNLCKPHCCWQFNFKFDLDEDMFAQDSIDLLIKSGISFADHAKRGIDPLHFGELLMVSGLVLDRRVKWVSFHSGYDFAYLMKLLTTGQLPKTEKEFFELLRIYFPTIYDIKYMTSLLDGHQFMGGLQRLADDLQCKRLGAEHQAGSDSLLTMSAFFALRKAKFTDRSSGKVEDSRYANELFGYGTNHTVRKGAAAAAAAANRESSFSATNGE